MLENARLAVQWIFEAWLERKKYRSLVDAFKTVALRISVTGAGKRLWAAKIIPMHLRGETEPIWLRRGTYDIYAFLEIFSWGEYEPARCWQLSDKDLIVDLGANVAVATRFFASVYPSSDFLLVEPDSANFETLHKNCDGIKRTKSLGAVQAFISSQDGNSGIDRSRGSLGFRMSAAGEAATTETIQCISVPSLLAKYAPAHEAIGLLKCDIEGAEAEVFRDCHSWIGRVEHLIVETHTPYTAEKLQTDLRQNGWNWETTEVHEKLTRNQTTSTCFFKRLHQL